MTAPLTKTLRFRILYAVLWFSWAEVHAIVLNHYGYNWPICFTDTAISNVLLAGVGFVITINFQHYIPKKNKYLYIASLVTVLTLLWLFASRSILLRLLDEAPGYGTMLNQSLLIRFGYGILINGCMALVSILWYTLQEQHAVEARQNEIESLAREAELYKLRQQLQPHFLFNSLNSINALIIAQPQRARMMIQHLSDFLRSTLKKEENQWISINEEILHLQLYLDIEKVRFEHRLTVTINNTIADKHLQIPAMLLQRVVENAIKFGLYDTTEPINITIAARVENNVLIVEVQNPFDPQTAADGAGTGYGLKAVQRRLFLLFARQNLVQTSAVDNIFTTRISIPQPQ